MTEKLELEGIPRSKTYREIITENITTLMTLKAGEESKKRLAGISKFQTLNIMEEEDTNTNTVAETQICYNNNNNSTKNKTNSNINNNNQNKVTVLKRDSIVNQRKENNLDI